MIIDFFETFIFSYRQIWLNGLMDDRHLSNITKLEKKEKNTDLMTDRRRSFEPSQPPAVLSVYARPWSALAADVASSKYSSSGASPSSSIDKSHYRLRPLLAALASSVFFELPFLSFAPASNSHMRTAFSSLQKLQRKPANRAMVV
jgi:hypothetical protein